jgi:hypothetical protein
MQTCAGRAIGPRPPRLHPQILGLGWTIAGPAEAEPMTLALNDMALDANGTRRKAAAATTTTETLKRRIFMLYPSLRRRMDLCRRP